MLNVSFRNPHFVSLFRFREVIWGYASITPFRYIGRYLDTSIGFNTILRKFPRTHCRLPCFAIP